MQKLPGCTHRQRKSERVNESRRLQPRRGLCGKVVAVWDFSVNPVEEVAGHSDDGSVHVGGWRESISWWMDNDCECALESVFTTPSVCFHWTSSSFMAAPTPTMRR